MVAGQVADRAGPDVEGELDSIGRMVGDYVAAVFVPGRAVGILSLAGAPSGGRYDQSIVAVSAPAVDPPQNVRRPSVAGVARVGNTVTCRRGTWAGTEPIRYAYSWLRSGVVLATAHKPRYTVRRSDAGARLACQVRAANAAGRAQATSATVRVRRG